MPASKKGGIAQSASSDSTHSISSSEQERWATGLGQFQEISDHHSTPSTSPTAMSNFPKPRPVDVPSASRDDSELHSGERTPLKQSPPDEFGKSFGGTSKHSRHSSTASETHSRPSRRGSGAHSHSQTNAPPDYNDDNDDIPFIQPHRHSNRRRRYAYMSPTDRFKHAIASVGKALHKYGKFIGPGVMVSVAYMDPGNYSTAVSAGALYQYKLLFVVLVSNLFAVFLQTLCVKLGSVTGLDLAQNCREHLPRWLCIVIYILAEIAIIATDLAEVVGTAISLNILFNIPLPIGVMLTVVDVLLVLMAYRPNGEMKIVRYFEYLVSGLVVLVVACFAIELGNIGEVDTGEIFRGFLPSSELLETQGLYLSCGILGATVMPHSLYLGSGLVQPRLREFDKKQGYFSDAGVGEDDYEMLKYKPSIHAINYAMTYSIVELVISLFTFAIFVNSAILIVAGATLSNTPGAVDADLFSIYDMLKSILSPAAGTVFALALLFSGQSAGIVCTLSGQMVSEGFLHWSFRPWIRRLITRGLAIAPCLFVSIFVGRKGLADVLNASQVVLSLLLPVVSAPLLYFTAKKSIMRVPATAYPIIVDERGMPVAQQVGTGLSPTTTLAGGASNAEAYTALSNNDLDNEEVHSRRSEESIASSIVVPEYKDMSNSKLTNITAVAIFAVVTALNMFMIVSMMLGADVHF